MSLVVDALKAKFVADRLAAVANLQTYLTSSVGVGEHPNIVQECEKLICKISEAEGNLNCLIALIPDEPQAKE